ncbi:site-2 protease family protein [Candidatus Vallotia cooleyia]|uniref:site-2 protease family protein n=1 Tax=Candidatus Vallotiella adelgis TaxID=1177211 RepID=UPI001D00D10F|nr:site-2 protease family protein [Candidatus Vallotia cooleyia]UDG82314.1 hypothetical protein GJV44_00575 [Candidatus Vallotia cooleyia]
MNFLLIQTILISALPMFFAITLHEVAHGIVASRCGDNTAYLMGRISLNPMRHIDLIGTIMIPLIMMFATGGTFIFGYAKPVPVDFSCLRNPRWDSLWISLAGPVCNLLQALVWSCMAIGLRVFSIEETFVVRMSSSGVAVNLVLCALNLFPILPLDGGRVIASLLPVRIAYYFAKIEPYSFFIVIALMMTRALDTWWLSPLVNIGYKVVFGILRPVASWVGYA